MSTTATQTQAPAAPQASTPYAAKHPVRIVTAAALFDGHDAAINVMRRILQATGAEIIHLGHNRSVDEVVRAALQEDAQGIALTSYQGGHMEYFTYMRERLDESGAKHVKIYGGGGGVIVAREIETLHKAGIDRIYSPEDGRNLGLQGMINQVVEGCDYDPSQTELPDSAHPHLKLAREITRLELGLREATERQGTVPVIGLTGTGGAGKSSLTDELVRRFLNDFPDKRIAVICVDPTKRKTGGALLGDRIRFNTLRSDRVYFRSLATRGAQGELSESLDGVVALVEAEGFDLILVETAGIGQGDSSIVRHVDLPAYVMTAEYGAPSQLEKIEMLDYAKLIVINKYARRGSQDALRDVRKQFQRNTQRFGDAPDSLPVFGTCAANFNDPGVDAVFGNLIAQLNESHSLGWKSRYTEPSVLERRETSTARAIIPPGRERYLSEISESARGYRRWAREQAELAADLDGLRRSVELLGGPSNVDWSSYADTTSLSPACQDLCAEFEARRKRLDARCLELLQGWEAWEANYTAEIFRYTVRGRELAVKTRFESLSELQIKRVALPRFKGAGDRLYWRLTENVPGEFPYVAGTFPFKRAAEDPTRMFAGEGGAAQTNARFHYLAADQPAKRLSTAFDSITLYGEDPDLRPDIYGKIGESGVAVFTVEEAEQLYAGFDLCSPKTSVSMTINGPAPTLLAFFFQTAVRQQSRRFLRSEGRLEITPEQELQPDRLRASSWSEVRQLLTDAEFAKLKAETLTQVRGTVQADILKEDQGQNTCIFSTEFSLKVMGDVASFFVDHGVRNFYSVSISGYHIAEAGANPIHQLAFTLANGFTYVEYYLARGMKIDDFAPSLSYFFSNGMDPEYTVIGRVARRIWAVALKERYGASARGQMLKYHIQTSGRSLHAMEIEFNDARTTLQALLATYDNAQSLHTNAYDEAITTPTEESVRRAMAIQLIINREFGLTKCENATQGSFIVEELTDLVEEAVLQEFDRITERGGVLGAMERQYQRGAIQEDSLKYEHLKHSGELPIVGVNTFLPKNKGEASAPKEIALTRASTEEKDGALERLQAFHAQHVAEAPATLQALKEIALADGNIFAALLDAVEHCSLGQITHALYEVGGEYRRNI